MSDKGFFLYSSWWKIMSEFEDSDFCEFMRALANYAINKKQPDFKNKSLEFAFRFVKNEIDMQEEKNVQYSKTQSDNGKKGGAPKGNHNAKKQAETSLNKDKNKDKEEDEDKNKGCFFVVVVFY